MTRSLLCIHFDSAVLRLPFSGYFDLQSASLTNHEAAELLLPGLNPTGVAPNSVIFSSLLTDSLPDLWGRKVTDTLERARARKKEVKPSPIDDASLLTAVCDTDRMGALRFASENDPQHYLGERRFNPPQVDDLVELNATARRIESGDPVSANVLERFAENAIALGGSRPKVGFLDEKGGLCLAKLPSQADDRDKGAWEFVVNTLAKNAGIRVSPFRLIDIGDARGRVFAARRFDRTDDGQRLHYLSMRALLGAVDNREARSYQDLINLIERICPDAQRQKEELWRRTVFKCLIHDGDDHLRNQGFLFEPQGWTLSPAFDLNASRSQTRFTLFCGQQRLTLSPQALLPHFADWGLDRSTALDIYEQVRNTVVGWQEVATCAGIAEGEIEAMRSVFPAASQT